MKRLKKLKIVLCKNCSAPDGWECEGAVCWNKELGGFICDNPVCNAVYEE